MVMPPPNVTGHLHIGHTLMIAIEDTIIRYWRMKNRNVCWVPGTDHAGIATQSVVEKQLLREGITRHQLGKEKFLEYMWKYKNEKGGHILHQIRRLGSSCDWSREAFTLSAPLSLAVNEAFVRLYEKGLIYRAKRLVCWSSHLNTALSEIEVDSLEINNPQFIRIPGYDGTVEVGSLWVFKYPVKDSDEFIEVATSRLETMYGDTAVAVNPNDPRYKHLIGKLLVHPFCPDRILKVIGDEHCDPNFGTGAVKITPAHDLNDYEVGLRHNLEFVTVFSLDGKMNSVAGDLKGVHRFEARKIVQKRLQDLGLFVNKIKNNKMVLPICGRSGDIVEYMLLPQWYMNCSDLAKRAVVATDSKRIELLPESANSHWHYWLDNIRDWCISRQLWWGHKIPAYKIVNGDKTIDEEQWVVARTQSEALEKARKTYGANVQIEQDKDVLDTWFSSGLFPFSVFGWPNETADFKKFFPTSLLETGGDILFFWVARMVMMSLALTDEVPFKQVFLHPIVRDSHGRKMSKSLGNIIDPLDVISGVSLETLTDKLKQSHLKESEIKKALEAQKKEFPKGIEECGADALRIGLLAYLRAGRDINLDINRVISYRHFCNKIWNASKFTINTIKDLPNFATETWGKPVDVSYIFDSWIVSRFNQTCKLVAEAIEHYKFYNAVNEAYSFFLVDFCDTYLEICKLNPAARAPVLSVILESSLRMFHPMIPFITEELWNKFYSILGLKNDKPYCFVSEYPTGINCVQSSISETVGSTVESFILSVKTIRSMLFQFDVPPSCRLSALSDCDLFENLADEFCLLAKTKSFKVGKLDGDGLIIYKCDKLNHVALEHQGAIDFDKVLAKLSKRLKVVNSLIQSQLKSLQNPEFLNKADEQSIKKKQEAYQLNLNEVKEIEQSIDQINKCIN